jgi:CHAT domain-containing protein/Flp pilus assembly protein TadD
MQMKSWLMAAAVVGVGGLLLETVVAPAAVVQAQTVEVREVEADRLNMKGIQQHQTSQFEAALQSWQQALALYRSINNKEAEGWILGSLGLAYYSLGNYPKAVEHEERWLAISQEFKYRQDEGKALLNLGLAHNALGNYAKAIDSYQQALAIAREIKNRQSESKALGNLGYTYALLGNYAKAISYHNQCLAIANEINDSQTAGKAFSGLGSAYFHLGDDDLAIKYHQLALETARKIKNPFSESAALSNQGNAYASLGDYAKAIDYYQQALVIARKIKSLQAEAGNLSDMGIAYRSQGDYVKAIDYQKQSLAISRKLGDRLGEGSSLSNLGAVLLDSGDLIAAEEILLDNVSLWESLREYGVGRSDANKISFFETYSLTYRLLQKVLIAENKPIIALEISERGRSRALVDLLKQQLVGNSRTGETDKSRYSSTAQIQQTAKAQNASLVEYSIIYDDFKINGKRETKESALYIWVIAPNGTITFRQVDLKPLWQTQHTQLADLITTSRETLGVRSRKSAVKTIFPSTFNPDEQKRNLQQLHKLLIEPIADLLPKDPNDQVIFIPQGELFLVPFPALQAANGQYLIEQHTLRTAPAIQVLDLTRQQKQKQATQTQTNTNLIIGNPIMPSVTTIVGETPIQLAKLPDAQREAESIANRLHTKAYTTDQARKATILKLLPTARRIHFATHGLLDDFKGLGIPGAIALAPDGTKELNDGLLTASEIFDLKLNADLVVLSACNTGNGKITGDGVIGLSRSFISAGVPSVVVSLWSVPDSPTADLMTHFYQNLETNPNKAQALRQAMLTTMKTHPNPIDWAAFTLIGEAE